MNAAAVVARPRAPLARTAAAFARGRCTVGFLGGSITSARTGTRWPEPLAAWLVATYPEIRFTFVNAARGATGSDLAAFRLGPELLAPGCDLVFVDYAVNDADRPALRRARTREGVLRQLLAAGCDVVLVHTFRPEMHAAFAAGTLPDSIAEFETLADHYRLPSVDAAAHALGAIRLGRLTWRDWLPDGLHPEARGSLVYAEAVIAFLSTALPLPAAPGTRDPAAPAPAPAAPPPPSPLPAPLEPGAWDRIGFVPFADITGRGPWSVRQGAEAAWPGPVLHCDAPGATLRFTFTGRGLVLGFDFGHASGEIRVRIDGGPWTATERPRFPWHGDDGWCLPTTVADDLAPGPHAAELETLPATHAGRLASTTRLVFIGVLL
jgi:lysophospholipase L1-like esterase